MRIDSATGVKAWLIGKFSGSFKGQLYGVAESASQATNAETASLALEANHAETASYAVTSSYALSASYAASASTVETEGVMTAVSSALDDPKYTDVFERLRSQGRLIVRRGIRVVDGGVGIDTGSLRIRKVVLEYLDNEEALGFKFISDSEIPPIPPLPPEPPYPPFPPCPPPPCPPPPCPDCPPPPPEPKKKKFDPSIDYFRAGRYQPVVDVTNNPDD